MLTLPVGLFELLIHQYRNGKYLIFMGNCCKQETPLHLIYHLVKMVCIYYNWIMFIKNTHNHCKKNTPKGVFLILNQIDYSAVFALAGKDSYTKNRKTFPSLISASIIWRRVKDSSPSTVSETLCPAIIQSIPPGTDLYGIAQ